MADSMPDASPLSRRETSRFVCGSAFLRVDLCAFFFANCGRREAPYYQKPICAPCHKGYLFFTIRDRFPRLLFQQRVRAFSIHANKPRRIIDESAFTATPIYSIIELTYPYSRYVSLLHSPSWGSYQSHSRHRFQYSSNASTLYPFIGLR